MTNLAELRRQYLRALAALVVAGEYDADPVTFAAALVECKRLRAQIEGLACEPHTAVEFDWK